MINRWSRKEIIQIFANTRLKTLVTHATLHSETENAKLLHYEIAKIKEKTESNMHVMVSMSHYLHRWNSSSVRIKIEI